MGSIISQDQAVLYTRQELETLKQRCLLAGFIDLMAGIVGLYGLGALFLGFQLSHMGERYRTQEPSVLNRGSQLKMYGVLWLIAAFCLYVGTVFTSGLLVLAYFVSAPLFLAFFIMEFVWSCNVPVHVGQEGPPPGLGAPIIQDQHGHPARMGTGQYTQAYGYNAQQGGVAHSAGYSQPYGNQGGVQPIDYQAQMAAGQYPQQQAGYQYPQQQGYPQQGYPPPYNQAAYAQAQQQTAYAPVAPQGQPTQETKSV